MKRLAAIAAAMAVVGLSAPARAELVQNWQATQDAKNFGLIHLRAPAAGADAMRLQDVAVGAGYLKSSALNGTVTASATIPWSDITGAPAVTLGGDLSGSLASANVIGILETGGPAHLTFGAIPASGYLIRSGTTVIGSTTIPYAAITGGPTALPPSGAAGGDLAGTYPNPTVAAIHETSGPTQLTLGAVPDAGYLVRSGSTLIGTTTIPGSAVTLDAGAFGFGSAGGVLTGDAANAHWDSTNFRAGFRTSAPAFQLHLVDESAAADRGLALGSHAASALPSIRRHRKSRGSFAAPGTVVAGDYIGLDLFEPYVSTSGYIPTVQVGVHIPSDATVSATNAPSEFYIYKNQTGSTTDPFASNSTIPFRINSLNEVQIALPATGGSAGAPLTIGSGTTSIVQVSANNGSSPIAGMLNLTLAGRGTHATRAALTAGSLVVSDRWYAYTAPTTATAGLYTTVHAEAVAVNQSPMTYKIHPVTSATAGTDPLAFQTQPAFYVDSHFNVGVGNHIGLATNATDGFLWLPKMAGVPSATPTGLVTAYTAVTGAWSMAPLTIDATNGRIYVNPTGSAWEPWAQRTTTMSTGFLRNTTGTGLWTVDTSTYLADPTCNGIVVRTASGVTTCRTLATDATIAIADPSGVGGAPTFSRGALTGAITASAGSNTTAFGVLAATSVLANATGSTAVPAALAASTNGDVLRMASGALGWGAIPESSVTSLVSDLAAKAPTSRTVTAGAGMTGGGSLAADRTLDVIANADGSITVNADDIQVGVLATDAQHGARGGGTQHTVATTSVAGFLSAADKTKLDSLSVGATVADGDYGDITVSSSGTAWGVDPGAITLAKMANIATDRLIGRDTTGTGVPEALTVGGGIEFTGSGGIQTSAFTGAVTKSAGGTATTFGTISALSVLANSSASVAVPAALTASSNGDVLRMAGGVLGWGAIPQASVTSLVSDLAGKQATGNYITALTGDGTAAGPGAAALTLATVNASPGTYANATVTVNGKGLATTVVAGATPALAATTISATIPLRIDGGASGDLSTNRALSIQGAVVSGSTSTTPVNLGALSSGLLYHNVSGGISTPAALNGTASYVPYFSSTGVPGTDSAHVWDGANHRLGVNVAAPAYRLDVNAGAAVPAIHWSVGGADSGGYLLSTAGDQAILAGGASFNGSNWIAKATTASIMSMAGGSVYFNANTGLSVGATFSPTTRIQVDGATGNVTLSSLGTGIVKSTSGVLANASAGTDYQAAITWPAAGRLLVSSGTSTVPTSDATLTFNTSTKLLKIGDGTTGAAAVTIATGSVSAVSTYWKDATPTKAASFGDGVPNVAPTDDAVISTLSGGVWSESVRWLGAGGTMRVASLAGSGTRVVLADSSGNMSTVAQPGPPSTTYKWSINFENSSVGIRLNSTDVVIPGDTGATVSSGGWIFQTAGNTVPQAVSSVWATNLSVPVYGIAAESTTGALSVVFPYLLCSGSGNYTVDVSLWKVTGTPATTGNHTQLAHIPITNTCGATASISNVTGFSETITAGDSLYLAIRRTDANGSATLLNTFVAASATLFQ